MLSNITNDIGKSRIRKTIEENGWTLIHVMKKGKNMTAWRCPKIKYNHFHQEYRRCTYTCRKNRIERHTVHIYNLAHDRDPYFQERQSNSNYDNKVLREISQEIVKDQVKLSCDLNISIRKISSDSFIQYSKKLISIGMHMHSNRMNENDISGIRFFSSTNISSNMKLYGKELKEQQINRIKEIKYINLLVDAGTVNKCKCIQVLASNPHYSKMPVLFKIVSNNDFTKVDYEFLFNNLYEEASSLNLQICSVICDNLRAQNSGLKSFLNSINSQIQLISHIPCLAHMCNRIFLRSLEMIPDLKAHIDNILTVITLVRKNKLKSLFGKHCPTAIKTRWFYIIEPLRFILQHKYIINEILKDHNVLLTNEIPDEWADILIVFLPLKLFLMVVEKSSACLFWIPNCIQEVLRQWKIIKDIIKTSLGHHILNIISALFISKIQFNNFDVICASSILSQSGRHNFRRLQSGFISEGIQNDPNITLSYINEMKSNFEIILSDLMEKESTFQKIALDFESMASTDISESDSGSEFLPEDIEENIDCYLVEENSGNEQSDFDDDISEEIKNDDFVSDDTNEIDEEFEKSEIYENQEEEKFNNVLLTDLHTRLNSNIYQSIYEIAEKKIISTASLLGMDSFKIKEDLFKWLSKDPKSLGGIGYLFGLDNNLFWRRAHCYSEWSDLSRIAMLFITIGTSEADVERSLSLQKEIVGQHTFCMNLETIETRIRANQEVKYRNKDEKNVNNY